MGNQRASRMARMMKNDGKFDEIIFPSAIIKYFFIWGWNNIPRIHSRKLSCFWHFHKLLLFLETLFGSFFSFAVKREGKTSQRSFTDSIYKFPQLISSTGNETRWYFAPSKIIISSFSFVCFHLIRSWVFFDSLICLHCSHTIQFSLSFARFSAEIFNPAIKLSSSSFSCSSAVPCEWFLGNELRFVITRANTTHK